MKTLLLTGFEPFGGSKVNPSEQVAKKLDQKIIGQFKIESIILPVDHITGPLTLLKSIDDIHPAAVICLGEAAHRMAVSIERVAINLMDYRIPDNKGNQITDQAILPGGPDAYFSSLPVRRIYEAVQAAHIPVELSLTAGAYLCNQVFYILQNSIHSEKKIIPAGFIHLPALPEEAAQSGQVYATMSLECSLRAVEAAIAVLE